MGAAGSLVATVDTTLRIPAFPVAVQDTTGCGDAYCAGFITALVHGNDAPNRSPVGHPGRRHRRPRARLRRLPRRPPHHPLPPRLTS